MKKRIISLAAAAVFVLGTLAGCGNSSTQTTDKTASSDASSSGGDLVTVRDAVMTGQLDQYATEIGLWQGIFEKYGIDLQTTEFVAGINTIDAVVNGTADIGMMADYAAVNRLGNTLDAACLSSGTAWHLYRTPCRLRLAWFYLSCPDVSSPKRKGLSGNRRKLLAQL